MSRSARIAIVVPTFNSSTTVQQTLKSLLNQGDSLELISALYIADDHSLDDTVRVARMTWDSAVPLVVMNAETNTGERENVNRAIRAIADQTDWILILHSDDIAKPNWIATMSERIQNCDDSVASICSSWDTFWTDGRVEPGEDNPNRAVELIPGNCSAIRSTLMRGCWWHISGCAIRMKALQHIGGFRPDMPQVGDWEWVLRCLAAGWAVEYIPRSLISYRQSPASVSSSSFKIDRDIRESLDLVNHYYHVLTGFELLHWHARRCLFSIRRSCRAITRLDVARVFLALQTGALVIKSYFRLQLRRHKRPP